MSATERAVISAGHSAHPSADSVPSETDAPARPPSGDRVAGLVTNQDLDPRALRSAFGIFPTGVVAVAALVDGLHVGLAASSFTGVSLDPPLVSFSVARTSKTWPDLRRADHVGVTVLADHQDLVCRQLAGRPEQRFDDLPVRVTDDGAITVDGGLAAFDCTVYGELEAGDHVMVLLQLHGVEQCDTRNPLVFHRSGFGRLVV